MARRIRTLRHWKQRFDPNARFVFRKQTQWDGETTFEPGDEVPDGLLPPHRKKRFWEAGRIELAEFDEPRDVATGFNHAEDNPERAEALGETSVTSLGGNWYLIKAADGREFKERGKAKMNARLDELAVEFEALERERREAEAAEAERLKQAEDAAQAKADELADGASSGPEDETEGTPGETDSGGDETESGDDETAGADDTTTDDGDANGPAEDPESGSGTGSAAGETGGDDGAESAGGQSGDEAAGGTAATESDAGGTPDGAEGTEDGTGPEPSGDGPTSDDDTGAAASAIDFNTAAQMPMEALRELGVPKGITDRDKTKLLEKLVEAELVMPPPGDSDE